MQEAFAETLDKLKAAKQAVMDRQLALLNARYDLSDRPAAGVTMSRGGPIQAGVRVKLPAGVGSWDDLAALSPDEIRARDLFPAGFLALPHANHPAGGMIFPQFMIDEVNRQEARDLTRFDLDFDLPTRFLPEFPPAIFLTTRPDLGDVSQGQLVTLFNYFELFDGILNPKQLEGLRLLLTPFPQQQFNLTDDRRSEHPSRGVACLDCHANGNTNGANHLAGDVRPQPFRHRIETPSLRGVNIQRLFGSQRALKSVEDFTESELRGQDLFFGKATCASCHSGAYFTDNPMHNLQLERFFTPRMVNGIMAGAEGPIKTFPLRGIKDTPPYFHDGRLLTLDDTVAFFNLILGTKLTESEKKDLVAFLLQL